MNRISFKHKSPWKLLSQVVIMLFAFTFFLLAAITPSTPQGESDDYMASTLALENHFSLRILESDIEEARTDFPEHYERLRNSWDASSHTSDFALDKEGNRYPWYMGTYSISCIPMKMVLEALGINQSYAFQLTNVLFYVLALLLVYFKLKADDRTKFLTILLLACSPTVLYYFWASAEMFMFALVAMAMVFFVNKSYRLSALFIAIVGTLNPTIMSMGAVIIVDYFIELYKKECVKGEKNFIKICLKNFYNIIKFGVCFLPFFITYIFNYIHFGVFNLQSVLGLARSDKWFGRFLAYLFDLNLGFLPYFFIAFLLFFIIAIWGIVKKRDVKSGIFLCGFLMTVGAYAITWHINCGMTGISRYNAWSFPIFVFYLTTQARRLFTSEKVKKVFTTLLIISAACTSLYVVTVRKSETGMHYQYMSPAAVMILEEAPSLYDPYVYTFISRVEHEDGGYWGEWGNENIPRKPVIYSDRYGSIKKILLMSPVDLDSLRKRIGGKAEDLNKLNKKLEKIDTSKDYQYINISKDIQIVDLQGVKDVFDPTVYLDLEKYNQGIYWNEGNFHWIKPDATIRLFDEKIKENGISIKYGVNQALFDVNNLEEYHIDLYINDTYVARQPLTQAGGGFVAYISPEKIPDSKNGVYSIRLKTNASFCPAKMNGNPDTRDMAITLEYVGR